VVSVSPRENNVKVGQTFTVDIVVENITGLQGVDFCLKYPTPILNVTKIEEGSFLKSFGLTFVAMMKVDPNYQLYRGRVWFAIAVCGDDFADGSGTLAKITFNATTEGRGDLDLFSLFPYNTDQVKLVTCQPVAIAHAVSDGYVVVSADPNNTPIISLPPDPPNLSADVNGDGKVDITDLTMVARCYGRVAGDSHYDPKVDFNENGSIDIQDIAVVAVKFHQIF